MLFSLGRNLFVITDISESGHLVVETGTILLDTVCLSEAAGKTTTKDTRLVERLEVIVPHHSRQDTYDRLLGARRQISGNHSLNAVYVDLYAVAKWQQFMYPYLGVFMGIVLRDIE